MPCQIKNIQCDDSTVQQLFAHLQTAVSLEAIVAIGWQLALRLAVLLIEETLDKRAQQKTQWPNCPKCGQKLQSKGFSKRQITTVVGVVRFSRRVGRCPSRCRMGQMVPFDQALQLTSHQRSGLTLKRLACLLAVFVPYQTAAVLLKTLMGISLSPDTIWHWVSKASQRAIETQNDQLDSLAAGKLVVRESIDPATEALPLLIGADGVMVPFRRSKGTPKGTTIWREVKVGIVARLRMDIESALSDPQLPDEAKKVLGNVMDYLDTHHQHIQYHQFKAQGLPIGSGMVESACKWLIIQRFKGVGMRWSEAGFNSLLHLRLAWVNNRFDELFSAPASPN